MNTRVAAAENPVRSKVNELPSTVELERWIFHFLRSIRQHAAPMRARQGLLSVFKSEAAYFLGGCTVAENFVASGANTFKRAQSKTSQKAL